MARGNEIIVSANPQGKFEEGAIIGTPKPGVCMEIVPGAADVGGRPSFQPVTRAKGAAGPICVLLADNLQGRTNDDAYVSGTRGFLYYPIQGEDLNMRVEVPGTGSGNIITVGEMLVVAGDNTGCLTPIVGASPGQVPFQSREAIADLSSPGNELVWCRRI